MWTLERRLKQSLLIKKLKPWERSTGAKTLAGKEISKMNALKHGEFSAASKNEYRILKPLITECVRKLKAHKKR
jgi:hypothetical protein